MKKAEKLIIDQWKGKIASNDQWALRAAIRIVEQQTAEEMASSATLESNGVGLGSFDADIVTSIVRKHLADIRLTRKQLDTLRRIMPKYSGQLFRLVKSEHGTNEETPGKPGV